MNELCAESAVKNETNFEKIGVFCQKFNEFELNSMASVVCERCLNHEIQIVSKAQMDLEWRIVKCNIVKM